MMRDSMPPDPAIPLSHDALDAMRHAVRVSLEQPAEASGLRAALRAVAVEAQARQIRAEQLIVVLKQVWHTVPEVRSAPTRDIQDGLLDRLITACIQEYYRER